MSIIEKAKAFALEKHEGQLYGKLPYSYHLQQVASKLSLWRDMGSFNVTDEIIAAGWLHDVLEDTDLLYCILCDRFGVDVAVPVRKVSKNYSNPEDYIQNIKDYEPALLVKMADTICNLEASLLSGELRRVTKYSKQLALLSGEIK